MHPTHFITHACEVVWCTMTSLTAMHTPIPAHQSTTPKKFFTDMNNGQNAAYCTVNLCISARTYRCVKMCEYHILLLHP